MEVEGAVQGYIEESEVEKEPSKKCSMDAHSPSENDCFDCNICLDSAAEPVVTLCGHLYCWPCIYKWLLVQTTSLQHCPVCKAPLSEDTLVPLYGRGLITKEGPQQSLNIPHCRGHALIASVIEHQSPHDYEEEYFDIQPPPMPQPQLPHHHRRQRYHPYYSSLGNSFMSAPSSLLAAPVFHSTAGGVLGELPVAVFPWMFRNHEPGLYYGSCPYDLTASMNSPRLRRQQMQVESSLHQLCLFLFCCAALFLFLL